MTVGEVFAKAWELWKKDIGWLILAGLVVGLIVGVIALIVGAIVLSMAAVSVGGFAIGASGSSRSLTGLGIGSAIVAIVVALVGYLIVSVLSVVFYGGIFEMVIGAAREGRGVDFVDVFSGFRKFGKFLIFWLVVVGIGLVCGIVALIPIIGIIADIVFLVWLGVTWIYVLPLIADRGMTFGEAAKTSSAMVKSTGWWKTLGLVAVLMVAIFVIGVVIGLIGRVSSALNGVLTLALEIVAGPFIICYVST
ncbi:MAG TPA: glycerophosphoryl diester phosphodiesterase membrane domain-containing protein, partial [Thermoleophilia bacterium]|nr:glycerophosphoryl diester phosphodiesterase membrane domain-containing protein [Thermoleophilia bacterium]